MDEMNKMDEKYSGKPWVQIYYHRSLNTGMGLNMIKNLITNFIMVLFFCWIVAGYKPNTFGKTFLAALFVGFIIFLHGAYTIDIWYETFDLGAHFADYMISWCLTGIWLGWWLNRRKA